MTRPEADSLVGAIAGHLEGNDLPPEGTCNRLVQAHDPELLGGQGIDLTDRYRFWEACVDWDNPSNSSITEVDPIIVPEFDAQVCFGFDRSCVDQPAGEAWEGYGLDALSYLTMYRFSNRYFPETGLLKGAVTSTVNVGGSYETAQAAVKWASFDIPPASGSTISIAENGDAHGTIDFDDGLHRWMSSVAIDQDGNLGFGYSRSGLTSFPSVYLTVREVGMDGPGAVQAESSCIDGTGSQLEMARWGDYSSVSVDPVDHCTFWATNEYVAITGTRESNTRICSFKIPSCGNGGPQLTPPTASFTSNCSDLACSFDGSGSTDSDGNIVSYAWNFGDTATGSGQTTSHTYSAEGTYAVQLTVTDNDGLTHSTPQQVTVTDGTIGCTGPNVAEDAANGLCWMYDTAANELNFADATDHCENLVLDGYDDWRLPIIDELRMVVDGCASQEFDGSCGVTDPICLDSSCDDTGCSSCTPDNYLAPFLSGSTGTTISASGDGSGLYWAVRYVNAYMFRRGTASTNNVRCVRNSGTTGCTDSDGDGVCDADDICPGFDDLLDADGDGTPDDCDLCPMDNPDDPDGNGICGDQGSVSGCTGPNVAEDAANGLCWMYDTAANELNFADATDHCENLVLDGYDDWRLPIIDELRMVVDGCASQEFDGSCGVTDPICLDSSCDDTACSSCTPGNYLAPFLSGSTGTTISASGDGSSGLYWAVRYVNAYMFRRGTASTNTVRCVRIP